MSSFFEIVYPINPEYIAVSDDSAFNDFSPSNYSYISKTSFDYNDAENMFVDITKLLKKEKTRLAEKFPDREFNIIYYSESVDDEPADLSFTAEGADTIDQNDSLGFFELVDVTNDEIICTVDAFMSAIDDADFKPSHFHSNTIH